MRRLISALPRPVAMALAAILVVLVVFVALYFTLGGALDDAIALNGQLTSDIAKTRRDLAQAEADAVYAKEHQGEFETLMKGDKLIPHTRRAAVLELQNRARLHGLSALNYSFQALDASSLKSSQSQPTSGTYAVSVENIDLKVGAAIDGAIYRFVDDISASFPGSIILNSMTLSRPPEITQAALSMVSAGKDSGLVAGEIKVVWRTAQASDKEKDK